MAALFKPIVDQSLCNCETLQGPFVVPSAVSDLLGISHFLPKMFGSFAVKFAFMFRSRRKTSKINKWFCAPGFRARDTPKCWTCIFKLHSLPSVCQVLVEFGSLRHEATADEKRQI